MGNQVRYIKKICGISSDSITEENIDDFFEILQIEHSQKNYTSLKNQVKEELRN